MPEALIRAAVYAFAGESPENTIFPESRLNPKKGPEGVLSGEGNVMSRTVSAVRFILNEVWPRLLPAGEIALREGTIRAMRHIHMHPDDAGTMGLKNGQKVPVRLVGDRPILFEGALLRVNRKASLEMHIDTDEANAAGIPAESIGKIIIS